MQVFRLLASRRFRRRAVSTMITASASATTAPCGGGDWAAGEDEGPFFDLDISCCASSSAESSSESEESGGEVDFVISLRRSCSASPPSCERLLFGSKPPAMKLCDAAAAGEGKRGKLRTLSFGSAKAVAFYGGRASFSYRSSCSGRLFDATYDDYGSPDQDVVAKRAPSGDVIRRYLSKISRRLRRVSPIAAAAELQLRKSRSASAAAQTAAAAPPRDDSLSEKQDGIASAIAHCKESLHRASVSSDCDS